MIADIQKLFEGTDISEEFKEKLVSLIESKIDEAKTKIQEDTEKEYAEKTEAYSNYLLEEYAEKSDEYIKQEVIPMVENYLKYAVDEFITENKVVVEDSLKVKLADNFLKSFSSITEQYNVIIPEGAVDVVKEKEEKLIEANKIIDSLMKEKNKLSESVVEMKKEQLIETVCSDMTDTQKEKLIEASINVNFIDADQYTSALTEIKESYKPNIEPKQDEKLDEKTEPKRDSYLDGLFAKV